jgi:hypothetical protein
MLTLMRRVAMIAKILTSGSVEKRRRSRSNTPLHRQICSRPWPRLYATLRQLPANHVVSSLLTDAPVILLRAKKAMHEHNWRTINAAASWRLMELECEWNN